ncbi:O-phosphoserine--tRNA ligase [Archaeoglobus profundus]|uniref:O-phosphoserine--tRNA(Cys) ligase n=1 Tax=Archaeoglobus profundus (strain DSM 5631 / JCM 9629 / NBRC 100127 / Av18) TaxID=572546 RepID=D2RE16_ARCPA|nr:O-phosphoserine--tRNA ligase [Archaeoglobus profundus]ADB58360.1 O-phosphoseryl-tRNA(Cys) synthetase [Archaeoglobus profundus DSM 5631]
MKFDSREWLELVEKDFESAWLRSGDILTERSLNERYPLYQYDYGQEHPVFKTIQELRKAYLSLGFKEVINPIIVEDIHVKKQFGKEALAVLDRCFYLATLPKPNVGISAEKVRDIEKILGRKLEKDEIEELRMVFHSYKKGKIDGDDLSFEIAKALKIDDAKAVKIIELFPEFKELKPIPTSLTLRSHMTTGWFITLSNVADKMPLPIKLFSIDRCFRREQGESAVRLYSYFSASCVLVDEDVSVEDGKAIATALLRHFGFEKFKFRLDEKRSKYYIPGTQTEVFAFHPKLVGSNTKYKDGWVEIATFGIYSPTALCHYGIDYPVLNLGLGVERLAMILYGYTDVRKMVYMQDVVLSDLDIAKAIRIKEVPQTSVGFKVANAVIRTAEKHANEKSPCEFLAFEGELYGKDFRVYVFEVEENTKLCGPAYANEIVVYKNSVYGIPRNEKFKEYFENGIPTGIRYIDSFAYYIGKKVEEMVARGEGGVLRVRVVESPSDVNVTIQENVIRYIASKGGKIDIRGPMFVNVKVEL